LVEFELAIQQRRLLPLASGRFRLRHLGVAITILTDTTEKATTCKQRRSRRKKEHGRLNALHTLIVLFTGRDFESAGAKIHNKHVAREFNNLHFIRFIIDEFFGLDDLGPRGGPSTATGGGGRLGFSGRFFRGHFQKEGKRLDSKAMKMGAGK
jgi:hypothetical protein